MNLLNIYNDNRKIYLFCRNDKGKLSIDTVNSFFPYYFTPYHEGNFKGVDGRKYKKILCSQPIDVVQKRTLDSAEADIQLPARYLIDKVVKIDKTKIKYAFIDIETLSDELPDTAKANCPVSCISIYNSFDKKVTTFYLGDYENEKTMLYKFMTYMKSQAFDLFLSWNVSFDYNFLYNRVKLLYNGTMDFAEEISPISKKRWGGPDVSYPAGISIVDYLSWFRAVTLNKESSYALDKIAEKHLGKGKQYKKVDFSKLSETIKLRNIEDVELMQKLEDKFDIISYYDEIRRLGKVEWEDLLFNSRILDSLLLQEAKKQNIVLPMKPSEKRGTLEEKGEFKGAFRQIFSKGRFSNINSFDLSSAYPSMIVDFNLDPINITDKKTENTIEINNINFIQNDKALLPTVTKKLMILKNNIKLKLETLDLNSKEYKDTKLNYKAVKGLVNSAFGVFGNRYFRLYNKNVASSITYLVRDLLHYIIDKLKEQNYEVLYLDTDGLILNSNGKDISPLLNNLIIQWAKEKYNKDNISTSFNHEGKFTSLLLLQLCRYAGRLETDKGIEKKWVGVEVKRKDSSNFMKKFQKTLINKILDNEEKDKVIEWVKKQIVAIKKEPLQNIGFPCKLSRKIENYKNFPIFARALQNTPSFSTKIGNPYYYIYIVAEKYSFKKEEMELLDGVKLTGRLLKKEWELFYGEKKNIKDMEEDKVLKLKENLFTNDRLTIAVTKVKDKPIDVLAFDENCYKHIKRDRIDWEKLIERNILNKIEIIFQSLAWEKELKGII